MENQQYLQEKEEIIQFWTGNPSVDIWNGQMLLREIVSFDRNKFHSQYLCCPKVPTHLHIIEFCEFIEPFQKSISKVRVFRGPSHNEYQIAIKMNSVREAIDLTKQYQRRKFNQIEPDLCVIYQLISATSKAEKYELEIINTNTSSVPDQFEDIQLDKFKSPEVLFEIEKVQSNCPICLESLENNASNFIISPRQTSSKFENSNHAIYKMKSEKMRGGEDDFTLAILCCHTFHWRCLKNWNDTTCPLCRYLQSPQDSSQCDECGETENLWVCLICGYIGCFNIEAFHHRNSFDESSGEQLILQNQGHSLSHFMSSKHTYAMEIESHNVWDFCKSNYVHRLIQNQIDGKLIEFGDPNDQQQFNSDNQSNPSSEKDFTVDSVQRYNKKIESLNYEYNQMLAQTLENQRAYYEKRLNELNQEEESQIQKKQQQMYEYERKLINLDQKQDTLHSHLDQERDKFTALKEKYGQLIQEQFVIEQENSKLKVLNQEQSHLHDNEVENLKRELENYDKEINEIKSDRNDIISHIKMSTQIKKSKNQAEISQGQTLIFETSQNKPNRKRKSRQ